MNKGLKTLFLINCLALILAFFWNSIPYVRDTAHAILNPSVGVLLDWNITWGLIIVSFFISLIISMLQKYTTDQKLLKEIKVEQKFVQEEMKKYKGHPEKLLELQKKQMEFFLKTFDITIRPALYTSIPFILLFRWFNDYFVANPVKIFGFLGWIWAYLIFSILFSIVFRKLFKLA
jgi:uncharacterized membrane protein (DUF106 family)